MILYLIVFIIVLLLMYSAYNSYKNNRHYKPQIIISVLILAVLAGLRSIDVGIDVKVYQTGYFNYALSSNSFFEFLGNVEHLSNEYLYLSIFYIVSRFSDEIGFVFFIEELIALIPAFYAIWKLKDIVNPIFSTMTYLILYYVETYNVVRQSIAIVFGLCIYLLLQEKKYLKTILLFVVSFFIHKTTIIALSIIILVRVVKIKNSKFRYMFMVIIGLLVFAFSLFYTQILQAIYAIIPIFPERYISDMYMNTGFDMPLINVLVKVLGLIIMCIIVYTNSGKKRNQILVKNSKFVVESFTNEFYDFLLLANIISVSMIYISAMAVVATRIVWYFEVFNIFGLALSEKLVKTKTDKMILFLLLFAFLMVCWFYNFVYIGNAGIYPYTFFWQIE